MGGFRQTRAPFAELATNITSHSSSPGGISTGAIEKGKIRHVNHVILCRSASAAWKHVSLLRSFVFAMSRLLLIDDNQDDRFLISRLISRAGLSVEITEADSLGGAETFLETGTYDLILLDLQLPDSSGCDTIRSVRQMVLEVPIVVLSGHEEVDFGDESVESGANGFLSKVDLNGDRLQNVITPFLVSDDG